MAKATTVRFSDEIFARLDQASARTGMPVNSIVIAACLEWMERHTPAPVDPRMGIELPSTEGIPIAIPPRWATLRRAVEVAVGKPASSGSYPFERFTSKAKAFLTLSQTEALNAGFSYIGTENMLFAAFGDAEFHSAKILAALGVEEATVRSAVQHILFGMKTMPARTQIVPTARVKIVIEEAFKLCSAAGDPRVSTAHLLLGLVVEGEGIAAHVLKDLGATRGRVESEKAQLTDPEA